MIHSSTLSDFRQQVSM